MWPRTRELALILIGVLGNINGIEERDGLMLHRAECTVARSVEVASRQCANWDFEICCSLDHDLKQLLELRAACTRSNARRGI